MLTLEEQFWSEVHVCQHGWPCDHCCWPWKAALLSKAAGFSQWDTTYYLTILHPLKGMGVYRLALCLSRHALLLGSLFLVCHHCDFTPCCNPSHLFVGTHGDNSRDARKKHQWSTGKSAPRRDNSRWG